MSTTSRTYDITDKESGLLLQRVPNVAGCRLGGLALTSGSAVGTFSGAGNTTEGLWPGMLVVGKGIPANTIVLSIDSETTFTMSENATATVSGIIVVGRGYLPEVTTKNINIEHFRDLFDNTVELGVRKQQTPPDGPAYWVGVRQFNGVVLPASPAIFGADTGADLGATSFCQLFADAPTFGLSDHHTHTPPREQTQKVSFVLFVCDDGALVPIQIFPNTLIAQAVED